MRRWAGDRTTDHSMVSQYENGHIPQVDACFACMTLLFEHLKGKQILRVSGKQQKFWNLIYNSFAEIFTTIFDKYEWISILVVC